jgi:hypothetical protein
MQKHFEKFEWLLGKLNMQLSKTFMKKYDITSVKKIPVDVKISNSFIHELENLKDMMLFL